MLDFKFQKVEKVKEHPRCGEMIETLNAGGEAATHLAFWVTSQGIEGARITGMLPVFKVALPIVMKCAVPQ